PLWNAVGLARVQVVHLFFFFSSRRRHTRFSRDWSSDVCSSDLDGPAPGYDYGEGGYDPDRTNIGFNEETGQFQILPMRSWVSSRSEERRVGKECRSRWSPNHEKKKGKIEQGVSRRMAKE